MTLRLTANFPVVWRDTNTVQVGACEPVVLLSAPNPWQGEVIRILRHGASESTVIQAAATRGGSPAEVVSFLETLRPALQVGDLPGPARTPRPVILDIETRTTTVGMVLRATLAALGVRVFSAAEVPAAPFGGVWRDAIAVIARDWTVTPAATRLWQHNDIPHLAIELGATAIRVGPFVVPESPCVRCFELHRVAVDTSWPIVASQLIAQPGPEPAHDLVRAAVLYALDILAGHACGESDRVAEVRWFRTDGVITTVVPHHPECGCQVLPVVGSACDAVRHSLRPNSATAGAAPA